MPGEEELIQQRREKLSRLHARGIDPYPPRVSRTHSAADAIAAYERWEADGSAGEPPDVTIAGRITSMRNMGKMAFLDTRDGTARIQSLLRKDRIGDDAYEMLADIDLADFIAVRGHLFRTKTQEITVDADEYQVLAKALRPPPEKFHGIEDVETRYRQRYLDLMANEGTREIFRKRAQIIMAVRRFLDERCFIEAETPVLQHEAGAAAAT